MNAWKILAPVSLAAAGVIAAAILAKKNTGKAEPAKAAPAAEPKAAPKYAPKNPAVGSYSFISGFKDAATVEMSLSYDADAFSFAVLEDEFLTYSGDSHVAVLYGEKFNAQFEYAAYYQGEDFAELQGQLAERYKGLVPAVYGENAGVCFRDGDNLCMAFPILGDAYSYLLVTLLKAPDNDDALEELPVYPDLSAILASIRFERR